MFKKYKTIYSKDENINATRKMVKVSECMLIIN